MTQMMTYRDFLNTPNPIDEELRLTLTALSDAHPVIRNLQLVQKILASPDYYFSAEEINGVLRIILQRTVQLARQAPSMKPPDQLLTVCEQNVLTNCAVVLAAALSARMTSSLDRLSKIASALSGKE